MRSYFSCFSTAAMMLLCASQQVGGQELQKSRPVKDYPRSLYEMFGVHANTSPDMEWQSRFVKEASAVTTALPLIATNTDVSGGPAGTEDMFVYRNSATNHCVIGTVYPTWATVFDKSFTTGPGSRYLQVTYTTQANIGSGAAYYGVALQCLVSQTTAGVTTTVACSNTDLLPFIITRTNAAYANKTMVTYSGYVAVDPSTATRIQIMVAVAVSGSIGQACDNNLILRY